MDERRDPMDVLAEVARSLSGADTLDATLERIVAEAVRTVRGAEFASVSLIRARRTVETVTASAEVCRRVDEVQYETGEGPCLDAIWDEEMVLVDDLSATDRWPTFAERAADLGICSMLAFRLFVHDDRMGALNLYASSTNSFTEECRHLGAVFAAHAAVAWDHAREVEGLKAANDSRTLIGQAQGILMAERKITPEAAFGLLQEASQRRNTKLRALAQDVVDTGTLLPDA